MVIPAVDTVPQLPQPKKYRLDECRFIVTIPYRVLSEAVPMQLHVTMSQLDVLEQAVQPFFDPTYTGEKPVLPLIIVLPQGERIFGAYNLEKYRKFSHGDFVSCVSSMMIVGNVLEPVNLNRYTEIHVSYSALHYSLTIRRESKKKALVSSIIDTEYAFRTISWHSRFNLIKLFSYEWTFIFEDNESESGRHFYNGPIETVHANLYRVATGQDNLSNVSRQVALQGLYTLYRQHSKLALELGEDEMWYYLTMTLPGYNSYMNEYAAKIINYLRVARGDTMCALEEKLAYQVSKWLKPYQVRSEQSVSQPDVSVQPVRETSEFEIVRTSTAPTVPSLTLQQKQAIALSSSVKPNPFGSKLSSSNDPVY